VPHGLHQRVGFVAIQPTEEDGHQQRCHLGISHFIPKVGANDFLPLARLNAAAVPLPFNELISEHSAESRV
jgi:hypothetical protein